MNRLEQLINENVQGIQISGIRQFFNKVAAYPDAVQLTIGQPDFPTPEHVKEAGKKAIDHNHTTYTPNAGLLSLREAAAQFMRHRYDLHYDANTEVIATIGASQAIDITFRTILEPGAEVILPAPVYPGYEPIIHLCGATPVFVDTSATDFKITAEQIKTHLTEKTRAIVLPYPSNPTGCTLDRDEMSAIVEVLRDKDLFILSDEIYSELIYDQSHVSIAQYPELRDKTIVINGLSKSHAMTGWRMGFAFAPAFLAKHMLKVHQYNVSCTSSISQHAAIEALTVGERDAEEMKRVYARRRDYMIKRLEDMGIDFVKPSGAFYIFPSIKKWQRPSFDFASQLLEEQKLAIVPGSAFSNYGEGYVRISYAYHDDILEEGADRLQRFLHSLS
ncbi:aminotransferase A [Caldalkalibacillus salinus]|uniref:aminotransferase A n=1 Tax=Caldalkalibacillus salinus TaxID=2803787 RepID=UPI001921609F|nr:aminotransferase A [Caldalkalibacillus salinus]